MYIAAASKLGNCKCGCKTILFGLYEAYKILYRDESCKELSPQFGYEGKLRLKWLGPEGKMVDSRPNSFKLELGNVIIYAVSKPFIDIDPDKDLQELKAELG